MQVLWSDRWLLWCPCLLLLGIWLSSCAGGSGSSGFDIQFTESAAIQEALITQRCVLVTGTQLIICPSDVTNPAGGLGSIETGVDRSTALPCTPTEADQCGFLLPFMSEGLPATARYRVATRVAQGDGEWRVTSVSSASPAPGAPSFDVPVSLERPSDAPSSSTSVQVAILVYLREPMPLPDTIPNLVASGADFAYVAGSIDVTVTP
jgi:hypothetical protein